MPKPCITLVSAPTALLPTGSRADESVSVTAQKSGVQGDVMATAAVVAAATLPATLTATREFTQLEKH